jgi:uncharacterized membrane protein YfcA
VLVGTSASFVGLGGGFLIVPFLLWLGFTAEKAVGTSFWAILLIAVSAVFAHSKMNNVDWRVGLWLSIGGVVGAQVGARLLDYVPTSVFTKIFGAILLALAVKMLI